jgi:hypothetical protein
MLSSIRALSLVAELQFKKGLTKNAAAIRAANTPRDSEITLQRSF